MCKRLLWWMMAKKSLTEEYWTKNWFTWNDITNLQPMLIYFPLTKELPFQIASWQFQPINMKWRSVLLLLVTYSVLRKSKPNYNPRGLTGSVDRIWVWSLSQIFLSYESLVAALLLQYLCPWRYLVDAIFIWFFKKILYQLLHWFCVTGIQSNRSSCFQKCLSIHCVIWGIQLQSETCEVIHKRQG